MLLRSTAAYLFISGGAVLSVGQQALPAPTPDLTPRSKDGLVIRTQALFLLKDNLAKAKSIADAKQRADVEIVAATVL